MDSATQALVESYRPLLDAACVAGRERLHKTGIDMAMLPDTDQFRFEQRTDPYTGEPTLNGRWSLDGSQRRAQLVVNADGSLMLECDLLCPHPGHEGRWAEQLSIWGRDIDSLKSEIALLAQLEG
ncbi:hypothetical protein GCM10011352_20820 [Marinobacterium zhoushanense]|uniref:Uncharacterized protein n=1 Tax=Marinobacterium zhoushanense TaxID=1679163 RepID=A0ABQ1KEV8_9GAMM|nr:hypothetical protein [Marinobacterium zhoushanense]GGB94589.1 hypothetical protein GCM10011352_20820 [Marinobacterium zhoushanense]